MSPRGAEFLVEQSAMALRHRCAWLVQKSVGGQNGWSWWARGRVGADEVRSGQSGHTRGPVDFGPSVMGSRGGVGGM